MNPLFLLFGIFAAGYFGFPLASGNDGTGTTSAPAKAPQPQPAPEPEPAPEPQPPIVGETPEPEPEPAPEPALDISLFIYDGVDGSAVREVQNGDSIDFGSTSVEGYAIAAEVPAGTSVGSMVIVYNGEAWVENFAPYLPVNLQPDLSEGTFNVSVTVYSGADGTGDILGVETFAFETTSDPLVVVEEPATSPDLEPAPEQPSPDNPDPQAPEQIGGSGENGGETVPLMAEGTHSVYAGRVATFETPGNDVVSARILDSVDHGRITVNPDNTMALVMTLSDFTGTQSFRYEATHSDGSTTTHTVALDVQPGLQEEGWGTSSNHYMLATDANNRVIVEHGDVHTKVYVSGGANGMSLADVAADAGVSQSEINGSWLAENGYGQTEGTALDSTAGKILWDHVTPRGSTTSNWLLFERGYSYDFELPVRDVSGESQLEPIYYGAWGEGDMPELTSPVYAFAESITNVVFQDIHFSAGVRMLEQENVIFDNVRFTGTESSIKDGSGVTIRNAEFTEIHREASRDGGDWDAHSDRYQALYSNGVDGLLIEGSFFDRAGWEEGYDPNGDGASGQPPSMFSHNIYLGSSGTDVTIRDIISMRAASIGGQIRPGGFLEDNLWLDNNIALNFLGGDYNGEGPQGQYTLMADNLVTSGAHKDAESIGGKGWGADTKGLLSSLVDNIITHMADPNNPEEIAGKTSGPNFSYQPNDSHYYDDTMVYNWPNPDNVNIDGLDTSVLDLTTIQLFTQQLLGGNAGTIEDLANFLTAQAADGMYNDTIGADEIITWFQQGFGLYEAPRSTAEVARFVPNDLGEGVRWDNRLNWTTEDLPGSVAGDSADLGGNTVIYNRLTTTIDSLELGSAGRLELYGGRLSATGGLTTSGPDHGEILLSDAGQLWAAGHDDDGTGLDLDVVGGRFVNTGAMTDASLTATGGEAVLAAGGAIYGVSAGQTLSLSGAAEAGFDDDNGGMGLLVFEQGSTLELRTGNGALGAVEEFRTGAFGDEPNIQSGIDLGNAAIKIDLNGISASEGTDLMLLDADEIIGTFDSADLAGLESRDATVVIDYVNDSVSLELTAGSGQVAFYTVGQESDVSDGEQALWNALTEGQGVFDETTPDPELPEEEMLAEAV